MLDLIGLGLIGPYTSLIINPESSVNSQFVGLISIFGDVSIDAPSLLPAIGLAVIGVFFLKASFGILIQWVILKFGASQRIRIGRVLMQAYQNMSYVIFLGRNSSDYIYNIDVLTGQFASGVIRPGLKLISEGIVIVAITSFLAWHNIELLTILIVLLGLIAVGYEKLFRRKLQKLGKTVNTSGSLMIGGIQEGISGLKEIRVLGKESYFFRKFSTGAVRYANSQALSQLISAAPRYFLEFILVTLAVVFLLSMSIFGYDLKPMAPILAVFGVAILRLIPAVNSLSTTLVQLGFSRNGVSRLYDDLRLLDDVAMVKVSHEKHSTKLNAFHEFSLSGVNFSYPGTGRFSLQDVSFNVLAGESIGVIGASGSGKTTLVDVILGLLVPQSGTLLYNKTNLTHCLDEWRCQVAYLPQDVFLIDGTLRSNIALGIKDCDVDEERLFRVIQRARLNDLVHSLENGVDTFLGERGQRVSGGQKQRIALARAFYHGRNVLILDEATSALDYEIENEIIEEIEMFKGEKTLIVIAHRLSILKHCEKIVRLDNGRIVQQGDYEEVIGGLDGKSH